MKLDHLRKTLSRAARIEEAIAQILAVARVLLDYRNDMVLHKDAACLDYLSQRRRTTIFE